VYMSYFSTKKAEMGVCK